LRSTIPKGQDSCDNYVSMLIARPPKIITSLMPRLTWDIPVEGNKVYLTFDDGPTPDVTHRVLENLKQYNAKGTFFCLGRNVDHNPEIYQQILNEGHSTGNHTYSHLKGWGSSNKTYFDDIELARNHIDSTLFRPPYGRIKPSQVTEILKRYRIIMWTVLSIDYNRRVAGDICVKNVTKNVSPGSIIVFHDSAKSRKNVYYALPRVLEYLSEKRYEMLAIPDGKEKN
jgi:peptidoglycan/xylan/chitin deacetylase (PgdA/CDA1 family)